MKTSKPWTSQPIKRVTAGILAAAFMLAAAGCGKKQTKKATYNKSGQYASGKEVLESDPYFDSEVYPLQIPIDKERPVDFMYVERCEYEDGLIIADYTIMYESREGADLEEQMNDLVSKTSIFDDKGNYITDISSLGTDLYDVAADNDGNICIIASYQIPLQSEVGVKFTRIDHQGKILEQMMLEDPPVDGEGYSHPTMGILPDGRFTVCGMGTLVIYGADGNRVSCISDSGRVIDGQVLIQDGKNYVCSSVYGGYGETDIQIKEVDLDTGKLGEPIDANILNSYSSMVNTKDGIFLRSERGCSRYDIKTGEIEQIFDWNDADVSRRITSHATIYPISEKELFVIGDPRSEAGSDVSLVHLTRAEKNPHAGKKMIVVGGMNMNDDENLQTFLDEYNHDPSAKARAILVDYYDGIDPQTDPIEVEKQIYLDFLSGTGPDILYGYATNSTFSNSNIMLDLNPYLDGPDGISRDAYFDNILRACERNGHLYHMPISFILDGMKVNTGYIDNRDGWTFDEFEEASKHIPDTVSFVKSSEYSMFLVQLLIHNTGFADYEAKTVDFQNNEEMKKMLDLARTYGVKEIPQDESRDMEYLGDGIYSLRGDLAGEKWKAEMLAVMDAYVISVSEYVNLKNDLPDGRTAFLGYPSSDGSGMICNPVSSMGITTSSKNPELAWELIRSFMDYSNYDRNDIYSFPINRAVFEEQASREMEFRNTRYERAKKRLTADPGALDFEIRITEEDIASVLDLISHVTRSNQIDASINSIICEEAAGYFAGDRNVDDVLKTIQNRASIVVKEL